MKIQFHKTLLCLAIAMLCILAGSVSGQASLVVFQDGFENAIPGDSPGPDTPDVGSYIVNGTIRGSNEVRVLTGPYPDGPTGAATGNNYVMYDRVNNQLANPVLNAILSHGFFATNTPFHLEFRLWAGRPAGDNNWAQVIVGGIIVNGASQGASATYNLLYNSFTPRDGNWKYYTGSAHVNSTALITPSQWELIEIDWDGSVMTGKVNGGAPVTLGTMGSSDKLIDKLFFRAGTLPTLYFVDDIKMTVSSTIALRSLQPTPNQTGVGRKPIIKAELVDVTGAVDINSIQFFMDQVQVTPMVSQATVDGANVTTVSYEAPTFAYGSLHTNRIVYSDMAANEYSKEWRYTVYTTDVLFGDTFEANSYTKQPFNVPAQDGSNVLTVARIGFGRPVVETAPPAGAVISDSDQIQITCKFLPMISSLQNGTLGVIPGLATETNTFIQTGQINLIADGRVSVVNLAGTGNQYLTAKMNINEWNTIVITYMNGTAQWNVSVNGSAPETYFGKSSTGGIDYGTVNGIRLATAGNGWTWIDSLVVSNLTTGDLLFKDGFENSARGSAPAPNSPETGTYMTIDPGVTEGGLLVTGGANAETWLPAPLDAPQTGMYDTSATTVLAGIGTGQAGTRFADLTNGTIKADFITAVPAGSKVNAEAWFNWQAGEPKWALLTSEGQSFATVTFKADNSITLFDGTSHVTTTLTRTNGGWQKSEFEYVVGASQIILRHNGVAQTIPVTPVNSVSGLLFTADNSVPGTWTRVDSVRATTQLGLIAPTDPELVISQNGDQLTISWTNGPGYILQANPDLANPSGWVNVPGGGTSPVMVPVGAGTYYRLMKPL